MTENQRKIISKWLLDNGNRELTKAEKESIKSAIDEANNLEEIAKVAVASLIIDLNR